MKRTITIETKDTSITFSLDEFESYRENNRLEVKAANGGLPGSLWETYSSFANTRGGCIICGVKERPDGSWKTTGLQNLPKLKKDFWDIIHNKKKVSYCLITETDTEEYTYHGDVILVIKVPQASRAQRPIYLDNDVFGKTYRRDHEGDYICSEDEVRAMIRDSSNDTPDMKVLDNRSISDFSQSSIKNYRIRYNTRHSDSAWTELSDDDFLVRIGAASDDAKDEKGRPCPTAVGLLMLGQEYIITREFPEYFLDYREKLDPSIRWTDRVQSQSSDWSGNVYDFFTMVYPKITSDFKKPFMTDGPYRVEETPKHLAVREAIANCLVNTDYYQRWGVTIEKYPDRIILSNPGNIRVGESQMLKGGVSEPRNKNMLKMFNLIGIGEHAGSGVPDIFQAWKNEGLEEPEVQEIVEREKPDRTVLTLPLVAVGINGTGTGLGTNLVTDDQASDQAGDQASDPTVGDNIERLLDFCKEPRSKAEIQKFLNVKSTRYVRQHYIIPLLNDGRLQRTIPDKPSSPKQKYVRA